jgi:hypothetical protein
MEKVYTLELNSKELKSVMDALSYHSTHYYTKKIKEAKNSKDEKTKDYLNELWCRNVDVYSKCTKAKNENE